jgi:membrane protein required for colicin V production
VTIFDYLVLFVLGTSVAIGILRGFIKEILSLGSWVAALVVANMYAEALAPLLPDVIPGAMLRVIIAFVALFIGMKILMMLVGMLFDAILKATGLTIADRALGSLFGLLRGVVFVLAGVIICGMTSVPGQPFWKNAVLSPYAEDGARRLKPFLPDAVAGHVQF